MESEEKQTCQWKNCDAPAVRHVVFGLSVFDTGDDVHISATPYIPEHFDLCERHIEKVRLQYVHHREYALGKCPKQPEH